MHHLHNSFYDAMAQMYGEEDEEDEGMFDIYCVH